ncbi:MOSC domain-containing protein [Marinobacter sp. CA1]|uniref:MOSC domain-containing protein n=1 Tax=Marinobacter sp. CA1 TaxID=2817656 RepID=UPI001D05D8C2|nr:MOSC domain-containing protein [Marinobacter sp. CA1]UDL04952.1 MOSC domain-containing protein [Marinobacter sp. CA1]
MTRAIRLESINVGASEPIAIGKRVQQTGIHKRPVSGPVEVGIEGVAGDVIVDGRHHGGVDQAVYLYSREDYDWWSAQLQRELAPGIFGENLTLSAFPEQPLRIGDRLRIADVVLELSAPRIPCATFGARMADPQFVARFIDAARPGVYARVLQGGRLEAGADVQFEPVATPSVTVAEMFTLWVNKPRDPARMEALLATPVSERSRAKLASWLARPD